MSLCTTFSFGFVSTSRPQSQLGYRSRLLGHHPMTAGKLLPMRRIAARIAVSIENLLNSEYNHLFRLPLVF